MRISQVEGVGRVCRARRRCSALGKEVRELLAPSRSVVELQSAQFEASAMSPRRAGTVLLRRGLASHRPELIPFSARWYERPLSLSPQIGKGVCSPARLFGSSCPLSAHLVLSHPPQLVSLSDLSTYRPTGLHPTSAQRANSRERRHNNRSRSLSFSPSRLPARAARTARKQSTPSV